MDSNVLLSKLFKSTSNASTYTLSDISEVTNPVSGGGYTGAKTLTSVVVTAGASAKQIKFDAADVVYTASGGNIGSVMYDVIYASGGKLIAWAKLSTSAFTVTSGNTLTNQFASAGIFTITSSP